MSEIDYRECDHGNMDALDLDHFRGIYGKRRGGARVRRYTAQTTGRMDAPQPTRILCLIALFLAICAASAHNVTPKQDHVEDQKLELYDGVFVSIPKDNSTGRMLSFEVDADRSLSEGRSKKKNMLQRILPMFILPFILQSAIMPLVMGMLKFMLLKSFLVGKLALTLIMINAFKNHNSFKGRDAEMASAHYGYHDNGIEHYASYLN